MAEVYLPEGTVEQLRVLVTDATEALTDLAGTTPTFTVWDDSNVPKYTNQAATPSGMTILCPVTTTGWAAGRYRLWAKFTTGSETPRLGPFEFYVT